MTEPSNEVPVEPFILHLSDGTGNRHGDGVYRYSNGDVYIGTFTNGLKEGLGKLEYASPTPESGSTDDESTGSPVIYHGYFVGGARSGEGTYTYANGDIYSGEWLNGVRNGKGVYHFGHCGGSISGIWANDVLATGSWTLPNRNRLDTNFENNKPIGRGKWFFAKTGNYVSGVFEKVPSADGTVLTKWRFDDLRSLEA